MKTRKELIEFLEKELDYDGSGGEECPHCHENTKPMNYWIDHKSSLSSVVTQFLGFKMGSWDDKGVNGMIYDAIDDYSQPYVIGDSKKDAPLLAEEILKLF